MSEHLGCSRAGPRGSCYDARKTSQPVRDERSVQSRHVAVMTRLSCVLLAAAVAVSCGGEPLRTEEVVGVYAINAGTSPDSIELHADGTYHHTFTMGAGPTTQRGRWALESIDGAQLLTFHDFVFGREGFGSGAPALWPVTPERVRGRVRLPLDDDRGIWYDQR